MMQTALFWLDIFGTLVFAISGAFRAVKYELDFFGVIVLSIATGVGGGIMRDVLLGQTPPAVFQNGWYFIVCIAAGIMVFLWAQKIARGWDYVLIADGIGLGVFAAIGATVAKAQGAGSAGIIMMAVITATGGGVIRDVLVREVPVILHSDFYASAVLIGGVWFVLLDKFSINLNYILYSTAVLVILLRFLAMKYRLSLPKVKKLAKSPSIISRERKESVEKTKNIL